MKIDRAGYPFIAGALAPAVGLALARRPGWALPFAALGGFFAFFFRDPDREIPQVPGAVLSPADGRVMWADDADPQSAPPGAWKQVTIFLSPMDVHINRAPVGGRVTEVDYQAGCFLPAYKPESCDNERTQITIDHDGQPIVFRQVVGMLARRIVCRISAGDQLQAGDRIGLMKFGSRMDVFLPMDAAIAVTKGDQVVGGETIIARLAGG